MAKISVIVPVYNVEKYLRECLDSLVNQTLADIEIICIDDGSTDSSIDILNEYASKDERFRIFSQENCGPSKARNKGLDEATGEYIYFMDSDDILLECALEKLCSLADENDLDLIVFKLISFDNDTGEEFTSIYYEMDFLKETVGRNVFSHEDLKPEDAYSIAVSPPGKLYRRDLIGDLRYPEGLLFEDNPFFVECFFKAKRVYFYDRYLYRRRIRNDSITTSFNKDYVDYIEIANMLIDISKRFGVYEKYREGLFVKILTNVYLRFSQVAEDYRQEFFNVMKADFLEKKDEYDSDEVFQGLDERLKEIFYSAIKSQNHREYDLSIRCIDLTNLVEKRDEELRQKNRLISNSKALSNKLNEVAYENRQHIKDKKRYRQEIERLNYVNSELMGSTSWKVTKPIRIAGDIVKK